MCKSTCKVSKLNIDSREWLGIKQKKPTKYHWIILFVILCLWAVWMAQDINGIVSGIEYTGSKKNLDPAIEISGVDFVSDEIKLRHQSLSRSMQYQCKTVSEDVLFAFQFSINDRTLEDHLFFLCERGRIFANAKIVQSSDKKIMCTEEYDGELKQILRSKFVTIKAIDVDSWRQVEYTTDDPKESCTMQHAIDVLELKWV